MKGADDLFSNHLKVAQRVIRLTVKVKLLPEEQRAYLCLKSQIAVSPEPCRMR